MRRPYQTAPNGDPFLLWLDDAVAPVCPARPHDWCGIRRATHASPLPDGTNWTRSAAHQRIASLAFKAGPDSHHLH